jgi:hypothetical protein
MPTFRKTFSQGRMNLDAENRLLQDGEFREAINAVIINNENSEEGSVRKSLSNKRLTNINFGANPISLGVFPYEARNRVYWIVLSDSGSFLMEYDYTTKTTVFVLQDTRPLISRVFNLKKDKPCTAFNIIPHEDPNKELILLTEDNMQPLCINISRAKTYGLNGFEQDDILLIKKPPNRKPLVTLTSTGGSENYMEETFQLFAYRYKYLDGEYSALSDFTNYQFAPGEFELDYQTLENIGMVNTFNAVSITVDTGDKRVTDIQVVFKRTNSNILYLIETFNKVKEGLANSALKNFIFSNEKIYTALPERELFRTFDNVPLKALAQCVIGNKVFYSNYLDGIFNLIKVNQEKVKFDYVLSIISENITGINLPVQVINSISTGGKSLFISFNGIQLKTGNSIRFDFEMESAYLSSGAYINEGKYERAVDYILDQDFLSLGDLITNESFQLFILETLKTNFLANFELIPPANSSLTNVPTFTVTPFGNIMIINAPVLNYQIEITPGVPADGYTQRVYEWFFKNESSVFYRNFAVASSVKTNRSYDVGIIYMDEYKRKTTAITSSKSTVFVPQEFSVNKNSIKVSLKSVPPVDAKSYKFVVKQQPLSYQIIYGLKFYEDGLFRWLKLEGANIDKVNEGNTLIVKSDLTGPVEEVVKVRVIEKIRKEKNFLEENENSEGEEIIEEAGVYIKIRPRGFLMDFSSVISFTFERYTKERYPILTVTPPFGITNAANVFIPHVVGAGSSIKIFIEHKAFGRRIGYNATYEKSFIASQEYPRIKEWFEAEVQNLGSFGKDFTWNGVTDLGNYMSDTNLGGTADEWNQFTGWGFINSGNSFFSVPHRKGTKDRDIMSTVRFEVLLTSGLMIFETEPKQVDNEIYYETEQSFDIIDGMHQGDVNQTPLLPAEIKLDFFNCYVQGNGAESYRIKDALNQNFLNIDTKPTSTSIEEYQQIRRSADITYGEAFVESSNINGLNVFNLSTGNFKDDLDKQFGSVQKLHSRDNNIVVMQEEKSGYVLFDKDAVNTADGNSFLTSVPGVLGQYVPYQGNRGIGKNRESFSIDDAGRIKFASIQNGIIARLSTDGIEDIVYGVKSFFRDLFISQPNARIISGFDPYLSQTVFAIGNEPTIVPVFNCSNEIIRVDQDEVFVYDLLLNNLGGDIIFNYNITAGTATIVIEFDDNTSVSSNVTGVGSIVVPRTSLVENIARINITPTTQVISYSIVNLCPIGVELEVVLLVVNDSLDTDTSIINQFRTLGNNYISNEDIFTDGPVTRFQVIAGLEGVGSFPKNNDVVAIEAQKLSTNNGNFELENCNRIGFLISSNQYIESEYLLILNNPDTEYLTVEEIGEESFSLNYAANFVFNRSNVNEKLYLIWDYRDRNPILADNTASCQLSGSVIIDVLANDEVSVDTTVEINTIPTYGTVVVNPNKTITYTHDGTQNFSDSFTYKAIDNGCSSIATVFVNIGVSCGSGLNTSGTTGIYEVVINLGTAIGMAGVYVNAQNVPDRFELFWDNENTSVVDSKYIGDSLSVGPPVSYSGLLGLKENIPIFTYNGSAFPPSVNASSFTVSQSDIADHITEPTDGNAFLVFNKTTALPTSVKLKVTGSSNTGWNLFNVICPTAPADLIVGENVIVRGFYSEADKASNTKSIRLFKETSTNIYYANIFGTYGIDVFGWNATNRFMNDGTTWFELDVNGNVLTTGLI